MAGQPEALNAMAPRPEAPFEIVAKVEKDRVRLAVHRNGKPVPAAIFHTIDSDLTSSDVKAGSDGWASWAPPEPGRYSVYVQENLKTAGEKGGAHYDEIREFATLAFTWPVERKDADPEAVALFEDALAHRAQWNGFPGFTAELSGELDGRPFGGRATVRADGTVEIKTDDAPARPWLEDQLESIAMHRRADSEAGSGPGRPRPVLRFADDRDEHPLGRLLIFDGGQFASSYRIKDHEITVVNRVIGPRTMTITVLDNDRNPEGRVLPRSYLVHYWNARTGALDHVETVQERWQRVGKWDLPTRHVVTRSSSAGFSVRSFTLAEHKLLKAE
jgi:hypothetical protein